MGSIAVLNQTFEVSLVVFDKDGLLFKGMPFWLRLIQVRVNEIRKQLTREQVYEWLKLMGVSYRIAEDGQPAVTGIDRDGITAIASPEEEIIVTAICLMNALGCAWLEARKLAEQQFLTADYQLNLSEALVPHAGFPAIFQKLRAAGIPYGIATSDQPERTRASIALYDDERALSFLVTPRDVRLNKPEPDMLALISERFHVPPAKMVMIGDSVVDMQMARNCGAIGIGIPETEDMRARMAPYADVLIDSLEQIVIES